MSISPEHRMRSCPSYSTCSANICPLETVFRTSLRFKFPEEADCAAQKSVRYRLGEGLPLHGLTKREFMAREMSEACSGTDLEYQSSLAPRKTESGLKMALHDDV